MIRPERRRRGRVPGLSAAVIVALGVAVALVSPLILADPYRPSAAARADARAFLSAHPMVFPEGWTWDIHRSPAGTLRWGAGGPADAEVTFLFVPGFRESIEIEASLLRTLSEAGARVVAMDLPGQGGSIRRAGIPTRPWADNIASYAAVVREFVAARRAETDGPLVVIGNSFGGHVSYRAALDGEGLDADGLVLLMPAFEIETRLANEDRVYGALSVLNALGYGHRHVPGQQGAWRPDLVRDPDAALCWVDHPLYPLMDALYTVTPALGADGVTIGWVMGVKRSGDALTAAGPELDPGLPVMMLSAGQDRVVRSAAVDAVCTRTKGCRLLSYPEAGHCLMLEPDGTIAEVVGELMAFARGTREG